MGPFNQFSGNAVGEKGLSQAGPAVKEQIGKPGVELINKAQAGGNRILHHLPGAQTGSGMDQILRIIVKRKGTEIFFLQDPAQTGLGVQQINGGLPEAVAFFSVYVACVPAVRAGILHFQIVGGKTVFRQKPGAQAG